MIGALLLPLATASPVRHVARWNCSLPNSNLPSSYVNPEFGQARSNVDAQAQKSIQALTQMSDFPTGWVGSNSYGQIAQWDKQQGTTTFQTFVTDGENAYATNPGGCYDYWHEPLVDCYNDDAQWAALASIQEFLAYGDETFKDRAVSIWNYVYTHGYVSQAVIDRGYLQGVKYPNNTVSATCAGQDGSQQSMIGGVYWENGVPQPGNSEGEGAAMNGYINSIATGLFANLGAQLCRLTGNMTYCEYSYNSAQWLDRFTVNSDGLLIDGVTGPTCQNSGANSLYSYNTGEYIAAYANLGALTNNDTATQLAEKSAKAAMAATPLWIASNGVLTSHNGPVNESSDGEEFDSILLRDLQLAQPYFSDSQLQQDIIRFINIQYWSATQNDSNDPDAPVQYGRNWNGPYSVTNGPAQATMLDVFNGLILNPDSAFPSTTSANVPIASLCS